MVKNNLLLSLLVASFTAPVFASNSSLKECLLGEKSKFVGALVAVDYLSSKFIGGSRAIEFYSNSKDARNLNKLFAVTPAAVEASPAAVVEASPAAAEIAAAVKEKEASKSLVSTVLDTNVSVGLETFGVNAGLRLHVVPLVAKSTVTCALMQALKYGLDKYNGKK